MKRTYDGYTELEMSERVVTDDGKLVLREDYEEWCEARDILLRQRVREARWNGVLGAITFISVAILAYAVITSAIR